MIRLDPFADTVVDYLATYVVHSTLLIAGCGLFCVLTRCQHQGMLSRLWKLAAFAGVFTAAAVPFLGGVRDLGQTADAIGFARAADHVPVAESVPPPQRVDASPIHPPRLARDSAPTAAGEAPITSITSITSAPVLDVIPLTDEGDAQVASRGWRAELVPAVKRVFAIGYLLWVGTAIGWVLLGYFRLRGVLRQSARISDGTPQRLLRALERKHRRRVELLRSDHFDQPFVFGLVSPVIVVRHDFERRLSAEQQRAVLAHEFAHVVRRDSLWSFAGRLLVLCFPIQPLNLLARRGWQEATEQLCDAWAVESGVPRLTLATCLARIAEWQFDSPRWLAETASSGGAGLVRRVERLTSRAPLERAWRWPQRSWFAGFVLLLLTGWTGVMPTVRLARADPARPAPRERAQRAEQTTVIEAEWRSLDEEIRALQVELETAMQRLRATGDDRLRKASEVLSDRSSDLFQRHQLLRHQEELNR